MDDVPHPGFIVFCTRIVPELFLEFFGLVRPVTFTSFVLKPDFKIPFCLFLSNLHDFSAIPVFLIKQTLHLGTDNAFAWLNLNLRLYIGCRVGTASR
jgi:hypothetical protein